MTKKIVESPAYVSITYSNSDRIHAARNPTRFEGSCMGLKGPISPVEVFQDSASKNFILKYEVWRPDQVKHQSVHIELSEEIASSIMQIIREQEPTQGQVSK